MPPITRSPSWASSAGCAKPCSLHTDNPLPAKSTRRSSQSSGITPLRPPGQENWLCGCLQGFIQIQQQGRSCQGRTTSLKRPCETKQVQPQLIFFIVSLKCHFKWSTLILRIAGQQKNYIFSQVTVTLLPYRSCSFLCFSLVLVR